MSVCRVLMAIILCVWSSAIPAGPDEDEREGGILGTGIVGTITSLGSIYVNGQHIRFDPDLLISDGVSVQRAINLQPGHTVAVIAHLENDRWQASHIRQIVPLVGPLQMSPDGQLSIMGTVVLADEATARGLTAGNWVAVSGLWKLGEVVATRMELIGSETTARIEGTAFDLQPGRLLRIGGTDITGLQARHIGEGDVVRVMGSPSASAIQATRLETGVFSRTPDIAIFEGYFSEPKPSGLYTVLGSGIVSYTDNPAMIDPAIRQTICSAEGDLSSLDTGQIAALVGSEILTACRRRDGQ